MGEFGWPSGGDSYAIGFDGPALAKELQQHRVLLAPCVYSDSQQREAIDRTLDVCLARASESGFTQADAAARPMPTGLLTLVNNTAMGYIQTCVLLKHPSFMEEREWRLVQLGGAFKFRAGRSHLVPYAELAFGAQFYLGLVKEVVIGPSPAHDADEASLRWFLNECFGGATPIRQSRVPYRAW